MDLWPLISGANATSPHVELPVSPDVLIAFNGGRVVSPTYKLITGVVDANAGECVRAEARCCRCVYYLLYLEGFIIVCAG